MEQNKPLEERVKYLEERVRLLEDKLSVTPSKIPVVTSARPVVQQEKKSVEWDVLIFQKILPPLFIIVFIIGVLWGLKAVSDYGILTNYVKVLLGFVVSLSLVILGIWQLKQRRKVLGQMLVGGAIPILMLTTFAMHQLYEMTGPISSFALNVAWIALGLFFTYKYKSQGIGVVSTVGGVFVPFLIQNTMPNIPVFSLYESLLFTLFLWIALRYKHRILYYVSVVFLQIALVLFFFFTDIPDEFRWIAILPIFIQHGALLVGILKVKEWVNQQATILFSIMITTAFWISFVFTSNEAASLFGVISIIYGLCLYMYQKDIIRAPIFIANALISVLYFIQMLASDLLLEGLVGVSFVYLFVYKKFHTILHAILSGITYFITLFYVFSLDIMSWFSWEMLHWIVFVSVTGYGIYFLGKGQSKNKTLVANFGVPYFAFIVLYFLSNASSLIGDKMGSNAESVTMNALWIITAILFMLFGRRFSLQQGKYVGVGILFVTLAKIILFDVLFVSVVIKSLLFIVLGVVGLLISRVYYKK
ncbi:DUF2339 domain-containing protein [Psychrobacillus sp.]|uniref:DUF2339 domain-containing protein n=1 Tax=Psychrobacillus sp. TaxID=1871623 RepID=UPI0028BDD8FC|nr:DUF2339 domain-containing protein [Psychrobacillus sp.]